MSMNGSALRYQHKLSPYGSHSKLLKLATFESIQSNVCLDIGCATGFLALENNTAVAYLVSTPFSPIDEFEINPLDEKIGIKWGMDFSSLKISGKDKIAPTLAERLAEGKLPK